MEIENDGNFVFLINLAVTIGALYFFMNNQNVEIKGLIRDYPGIMDNKIGSSNTSNKSYASIVPNFNLNAYSDDESLIMNKTTMGPPPYRPDFN